MPRVTVKDVHQQEFVRALAFFLKKSRKLKVPEWVDTVKLAKHKEPAPYDENASAFHARTYIARQAIYHLSHSSSPVSVFGSEFDSESRHPFVGAEKILIIAIDWF
uniref:Uncharacterized protein n=1 Tax=Castor canadensis TaxID=51338 RepID=A0A8C0WGL0_CASCN